MSAPEALPSGDQTDAPARKRSVGQYVDVWLARARRLLLRRLPAEEAREVREHVDEEGKLTERYALMCALSAGIATLGLLQSSSAVVIGAMLVSPLMSPIAKLGFSFGSLDARRAQEAARVLLIGAAVGVAVGMILTWLSPIRNATPEIIARTAPTLLDLAIAVLSGLAGGYASVHRRGETAIGVAIATALMPPLATIGYSLAVARFDFALGAGLLFLTNLAAIAFSFALVARVRGVVRPIANVEFKRRYVVLGVAVFLALATPLTLTLHRVTQETIATQSARREIGRLLQIEPSQIAQLAVLWPNMEPPRISATAITPTFVANAEEELRVRLGQELHAPAQVELRQIVASGSREQTRAIVDAALGQRAQAGGGTANSAPVAAIREAARVNALQTWVDPSAREVRLLVGPNEQWSLADFRREEERLRQLGFGWTVTIVPPYANRLPILFGDDVVAIGGDQRQAIATAVWALNRWGVQRVSIEGLSGANTGVTRTSRVLAQTRATNLAAALRSQNISTTPDIAATQTSRALAREGAQRVRAADILPFAGNE